MFLGNLLGMKMKIIRGFSGTTEIICDRRNEVQASQFLFCSARRCSAPASSYLFRGRSIPIPHPRRATAFRWPRPMPTRCDAALSGAAEIGRPFLAPPGLPRIVSPPCARPSTTRADKGLIEDAKTEKLNLNPRTGQELAAIVKSVYGSPHRSSTAPSRRWALRHEPVRYRSPAWRDSGEEVGDEIPSIVMPLRRCR